MERKEYKGYLIDLDGTIYKGTQVIPEAVDFIFRLRQKGIPYLYVTNNSSKTSVKVAEKLTGFGIEEDGSRVLTSSQAASNFLSVRHPGASVYAIGEEGLLSALVEKGLKLQEENPDIVVMGIDREISYEKLAAACQAVRSGASFYSTNSDAALPTERGLLPGNGALTSVVSVATGQDPVFIGKPHTVIMEEALYELGMDRSEVLMVGDNYDTDILAGIHAEVDTLLVHTGVTSEEVLATKSVQPTYTLQSLSEWPL